MRQLHLVQLQHQQKSDILLCIALVVQWIELRTSKPLMLVRFQPRALYLKTPERVFLCAREQVNKKARPLGLRN